MCTRKVLLALILSIATGAAVQAVTPIHSVERPIEISTSDLILPSSLTGTLTCGDHAYPLTANTTYWIGERAVTFTDFGKFLQGLNGRTPHNGAVLLSLDGKQVMRVYIAADAANK